METDKTNAGQENVGGEVFFAPDKYIQNIENVIEKLEKARKELLKVAEGMRPVEN